jgi:hypothetical protein
MIRKSFSDHEWRDSKEKMKMIYGSIGAMKRAKRLRKPVDAGTTAAVGIGMTKSASVNA